MATDTSTDAPAAPAATRWVVAILAAEVLLATVLGSIRLGHKSLWYDEAFSAVASGRGLSGATEVARELDSNMPLFIFGLTVWRRLGEGDATLRAVAVVFAAASVVAIYLLGARLFDRAVGLLAGLLLAIAPYGVEYSQELRGYSLLVLLVTLGSFCFVMTVETRRWWWAVAYAVVSAASLYAHLVGALIVVAQVVTLLALGPRRVPWRPLLGAGALTAVLLLPLASFVRSAIDSQGVRETPTLSNSPQFLANVAGGWILLAVLLGLAGLPAVAAWRSLRHRGPSPEAWRWAFAPIGIVVPYVALLGYALLAQRNWSSRYLIVVLPFLAIAAAAGLRRVADRRVAAGLLALVVVVSGVEVVTWYRQPPREDWRTAAGFVVASASAADGIVHCGPFGRVPFEHYLRSVDAQSRPEPLSPLEPWDGRIHLDAAGAEDVSAWADRPGRIWVVKGPDYPLDGPGCDLTRSMGDRAPTERARFGAIVVERWDQ
jgi:mannosyltransferase